MTKTLNILYSIGGILIPFIGTSFGSSFVFFMKKSMSENFQKIIVGFASFLPFGLFSNLSAILFIKSKNITPNNNPTVSIN